jgi:metallophosphoesterase (TIGR00282 family)
MQLSVLYFGDVVGRPGREMLAHWLPILRAQYEPDLVFANIENCTHGRGILPKHYEELMRLGLDACSSGDHVWKFKELLPELDRPNTFLLRPANLPKAPGKGYLDLIAKGKRIRLVNLIGRTFMNANVDSPFQVLDRILEMAPKPDCVIVDFHAEATSEKRALAEYAGSRVQLVVGTHTHVPTADAQILERGTAFLSDLGMCGPQDSSLGAEKQEAIKGFLTGLPWNYTVAEGICELGAAYIVIDLETAVAQRIEHLRRIGYSTE